MANNGALPDEPHKSFDTILTLDFGSQYTHLITRRLRELNVYSEMLPCTQKLEDLSWKPKGIILSGGPYSVYDNDAPHVDPAIFELGVPILGICYGLQEIAWHNGKNVVAGTEREFGHSELKAKRFDGHVDLLFKDLEDDLKPLYGIQFHPEVTHTPRGIKLLENFAVGICKAKQDWTMDKFVDKELARIRALVGEKGQVLGAVSGGVDSTVAAKLMHEAIGDRFHAVLVDNGCMRLNECEQVKKTLTEHLGINLTVVDASDLFLDGLKGITDNPEAKRKFIGGTFIDVFEAEALKIEKAAADSPKAGKIEFFLQGTLYPDVIESISFKGPSQTIKTHHNVGGLPERMMNGQGLKLIEPLRELFKDEVREMGRKLGIPHDLIMRHPFPGPGIAIRVLGEVTREQVAIARKADYIFIEEIKAAGLYDQISQAFAALLPVKAVGVMGDKRVHQQVISLRAVQTTDFMTANIFRFDWDFLERVSTRIVNEVDGVCRVEYDLTSKPPGTIEME
ncbi:GMP synthase [glutamine-hydrolyzing] [Lachnellula subtilissima]|uniref:GMP synthase [glutamine-hydrolyzing] n=1 Tax=Lachnellula subtilissima TaxID=602034 RepID=A0A8H8RDD6_9HELO|nr:GMP synthase [glutamine-hydrolyzing] [Lachnellula subtilissima]